MEFGDYAEGEVEEAQTEQQVDFSQYTEEQVRENLETKEEKFGFKSQGIWSVVKDNCLITAIITVLMLIFASPALFMCAVAFGVISGLSACFGGYYEWYGTLREGAIQEAKEG
jgi:hypothetical protein